MRGPLTTVLFTLLLAVPALASAQVYKWKDANGTTHFSENPPPQGVKYENIRIRPDADQPRGGSGLNSSSQSNNGGSGGNDRASQLKRYCAQLQSNISMLQSGQSVQRMGSNGKNVALDSKARATQLQQQQQRYQAYCK